MSSNSFRISANFIDIFNQKIFPAEITVENGKISEIKELTEAVENYILPGLVDSHIHIESSMLVPTEFARLAVVHGTVATVSDPHEIANVCGVSGVEYMLNNAAQSPLKFNFGAPSCVPATSFETAGAYLGPKEIKNLLSKEEIKYLAEMMNYPGVLHADSEVMEKIRIAHSFKKPIDGHAPGLMGKDAEKYAAAGISTDHECFTADEALDKIKVGMKILIREGSAAKNFDALIPLLKSHPEFIMFCSDDKHPDDLIKGHINQLVTRALAKGCDLYDTLYAACIHPVQHYNLDVGLLRKGDPADFILIDNPESFKVLTTYIDGKKVAENGKCLFEVPDADGINHFEGHLRKLKDFQLKITDESGIDSQEIVQVKVIVAKDKQLITDKEVHNFTVKDEIIEAQPTRDLLKIGVVNRYEENAPVAMGFVKNFGLGEGAIASSVAHDSHNIVFVGGKDENIREAVNALILNRGGISISDGEKTDILPLPIAGLMTDEKGEAVGKKYDELSRRAINMGSKLTAPFMTLSFMALPVIPSLKITDKGLFDVDAFKPVELK